MTTAAMLKGEYKSYRIIIIVITPIPITFCHILPHRLTTGHHRQPLSLTPSHISSNNDNDHDDRTSSDLVQNADRDQDQAEGNDEDGPSMSNYEYVKPWGGMHGFMRSYGIAREPGGYEEAGELRDAMMEAAHKNRNLKG